MHTATGRTLLTATEADLSDVLQSKMPPPAFDLQTSL
jgi:hypothetical protein